MRTDLMAGTAHAPARTAAQAPTILVFDSGVGGLTVFAELRRARPDARFVYAVDDAAFPYGRLDADVLLAHIEAVMERLVAAHAPDLVVIACNTASTLVLPPLRRRFAIPFVGTVPAIRPAARISTTRRFTVLATPGTVKRDYTRDLVAAYAADCAVDLVGSSCFAAFAEAELAGVPVSDAEIAEELAPCFVDRDGRRTDVVALACTHYPLLRHRFEALAPWPVTWIDPAPAIAKRVVDLVGTAAGREEGRETEPVAVCTGPVASPALRATLARWGIAEATSMPVPLVLN